VRGTGDVTAGRGVSIPLMYAGPMPMSGTMSLAGVTVAHSSVAVSLMADAGVALMVPHPADGHGNQTDTAGNESDRIGIHHLDTISELDRPGSA
jgi:hypothetical protein